MKCIILAFAIFISISSVASAQSYNSQTYGGTTYYNGNDGYHGSSQTYGGQTYYNDNRGNNCTSSTYGGQTYTNCY